MSEYIHKSHNVSVLIYHYVCPAKYRRVVFDEQVDGVVMKTCQEIEKRYEIRFLEIGADKDHIHFLVQSIPRYSPTEIITKIKSLTAREVFAKHPEVKKKLWGGQFWGDGYFVSTVSKHGNEEVISRYVKNQGTDREYKQLHRKDFEVNEQLSLFD